MQIYFFGKILKHKINLKVSRRNRTCLIDECIQRVKHGKAYRASELIPKSTLHDAFEKMQKRSIIKNTYMELLKKYFEKSPSRKLLYRHKDSTCVVNKYGSENVKYNRHKKRKVTNVSLETDSNGVSIHQTINNGNEHDSKIFQKDIKVKYLVDNDLLERFSKYYCADAGYDTKFILEYLKNSDLIPIDMSG